MDSKLAATQLHWDLQPRLQGGLCHISALLLRGALSGHLGEEFNGLFRGPLDDAMPHIEDVMSPPSISYTLFHCFMDHILSAKQDHWINVTLQMQYPNGKLEFQLPERNTDRSYSLHPYYKSLVPNLMSILETEERTDMTQFQQTYIGFNMGSVGFTMLTISNTLCLHCFGQQSLCSPVHEGSHITWRTPSSPNNDLAWCISVAQSK